MAKSKYATRDGVCVDKACKRVFLAGLFDITFYARASEMAPMIQASAAKIGPSSSHARAASEKLARPGENIPDVAEHRLAAGLSGPADLHRPALRRAEHPRAVQLQHLARRAHAGEGEAARRQRPRRPRAERRRDIARVPRLAGAPRLDCYAALDRKLSTEIVPWIPFLRRNRITILGPQVAKWVFDCQAADTAFAHVAVKADAAGLAAAALAAAPRGRGPARAAAAAARLGVPRSGAAAPTASAGSRLRAEAARLRLRRLRPDRRVELRRDGIYSNLLVRTLVGYDHVAGPAGTRLVPDLAGRVPAPTNGGRTYTFTLKRGIRFGPPVDREITSRDIRYALERLARPRNGAQYPFPSASIRGFDAYRAGQGALDRRHRDARAEDDLVQADAAGRRLPAPPDAARGRADPARGRAVLRGEAGALRRRPRLVGPVHVRGRRRGDDRLVPRRSADARAHELAAHARPQPALRPADRQPRRAREQSRPASSSCQRPPAVELIRKLTPASSRTRSFVSPKMIGRYAPAPRRHGALRVEPTDFLFYISLNLTQPPFDDVHVRRALAWVLDQAALRDAWGGPPAGPIARGTSSPTSCSAAG